jgi:hypothetical protein
MSANTESASARSCSGMRTCSVFMANEFQRIDLYCQEHESADLFLQESLEDVMS